MRIRIHRGVVGEDGQDWLPGTEHDASDHFARELCSTGRASLVSGEAAATLPAAPALTTAGVIESRDPKPRSRR